MVVFGLLSLFIMSAKVVSSIDDEVREDSFPAITVQNCGTSIIPPSSMYRIAGGKKAERRQYPWLVSLHENGGDGFGHICGGSILNERWILTAAHCIDFINEPRKYRAYAGLRKLSKLKAPNVQKIKISEIIIHEDFDNETMENDIALLKTSKAINIAGSRGYVNGICLPRSNEDPAGYAQVAGWGRRRKRKNTSNTLQEAVLPIIPREVCNESYDEDPFDGFNNITETMICAGMHKRDTCRNDSGGGLTQRNANGVSTLIGIISFGGCGEKDYPGGYTKVSSYMRWIRRHVRNN